MLLPLNSNNFVTAQVHVLNCKIPEYISSSLAIGTGNNYLLIWKSFELFCSNNKLVPLPASIDTISMYLIKKAEDNSSVAPALSARSAIKHYHLLKFPHLPSPTDNVRIKMIINSIKRKFSKPVKKSQPLSKENLHKLLNYLIGKDLQSPHILSSSLSNWRLAAKSVLKFCSFARFEEVIELKLSNFSFLHSGDVTVNFTKGKNNQFHECRSVLISKSDSIYNPVNIFRLYFQKLNCDSDFPFLPTLKTLFTQSGTKCCVKTIPTKEPMSYNAALRNLRQALSDIGLDSSIYGEHSDKSGGLSTAGDCDNISLRDLQLHGRWKSNKPLFYIGNVVYLLKEKLLKQ